MAVNFDVDKNEFLEPFHLMTPYGHLMTFYGLLQMMICSSCNAIKKVTLLI